MVQTRLIGDQSVRYPSHNFVERLTGALVVSLASLVFIAAQDFQPRSLFYF